MQLEAHYSIISKREKNENPGKKGRLHFCEREGTERAWKVAHYVAGKAEARKLAKHLNATPWNF